MDAPEIIASRITIVDSQGEPSIMLDGGNEKAGASIELWSKKGASIQIRAQPGGHITLSMMQSGRGLDVTIGAHGVTVNDRKLRPGVAIGNCFLQCGEDIEPGISVFREGQLVWSMPAVPPDE